MKFTIIYYDDDQELLFITKRILTNKGFTVYCYSNTENILTDIENNQPNIILMDLSILPDGGAETLLKLQSKLIYQHIPVLFVSGNAYIAEITKTSGASGYLEKPFTINDLLKMFKLVTGSHVTVEADMLL